MRSLLKAGLVAIVVGTLVDLAYHLYMEPDEVIPKQFGFETVTHLTIGLGLAALIFGAILIALQGNDE